MYQLQFRPVVDRASKDANAYHTTTHQLTRCALPRATTPVRKTQSEHHRRLNLSGRQASSPAASSSSYEKSARFIFHQFLRYMFIFLSTDSYSGAARIFVARFHSYGVVSLPRYIVCNAVFPMSRPSVCPSVERVNCDKTKAPSEKSSTMTNLSLIHI